jgi:protease-4
MRGMRRWVIACIVVFGAGCKAGSKETVGEGFVASAKNDPWAARPGAPGNDASVLESLGGGEDGDTAKGFQQTLGLIIESIKRPGPYEAPERGAGYDKAKPHYGVIELGGSVVEREAYTFSLFGGGGRGSELRELGKKFETYAKDANLSGLIVRVDGLDISLPDAIELRAVLKAFRAKNKQLACFTEGVSGVTYLVMTACDRIGLAPLGEVVLTGPSAMPLHVKPLLDTLSIKPDFLHVGAYKGAADPLLRDAPSPEMIEVLNQILDRHYATMVDIIAGDRGIAPDAVKAVIDEAMFDPEAAQTAKLVDRVATYEEFRTEVAGDAWGVITDDDDDTKTPGMMKLMQFAGIAPVPRPTTPHIALVYALGSVVDGDGSGVLGARAEIASGTLVAALRALAADETVKGVVLRIDSGGGSALASELIWRAVTDLEAKKPVVVSMSDVAASGGYYIAAGATKIFALDDTLTGSIGVVGGKLAIGGGLDKLGIKTYPMGRGKRSTMFTSLGPWNDDQRAAIQKMMDDTYEVFVSRVAAGRGKTPDQVKPIAQGHIWTGAKAVELGLVDAIGGLDAAIAEARKLAAVPPDSELEVYPPEPTLRDFIHGFGGMQAPFGIAATAQLGQLDTLLSMMPAPVAVEVRRLLDVMFTFQGTPIQARAFVPPIAY